MTQSWFQKLLGRSKQSVESVRVDQTPPTRKSLEPPPPRELLDPDIRDAVTAMPTAKIGKLTLPIVRAMLKKGVQAEFDKSIEIGLADTAGVVRDEVMIAGLHPEDPKVRCQTYRPVEQREVEAALLHIHGGGYVSGSPEALDPILIRLAAELGIVIVSVDYRLAPEHPIPAPLDDCYAALKWMHENAEELRINPTKIAVGGESAGGGLAAALAQLATAEADYPVCFQLLTYPMLDDRTGSDEAPGDPLVGEFVWNRGSNAFGWKSYLGGAEPKAPYVPARAETLAGLPPAWIGTGMLDLFRDENVEYAQRLMAAGVQTELIVYPGACHAFQMAKDAPVTNRFWRDHSEALARGLQIRNKAQH